MQHHFAHRARIAAQHRQSEVACLELLAGLRNMTQPLDHKPTDGSILIRFREF